MITRKVALFTTFLLAGPAAHAQLPDYTKHGSETIIAVYNNDACFNGFISNQTLKLGCNNLPVGSYGYFPYVIGYNCMLRTYCQRGCPASSEGVPVEESSCNSCTTDENDTIQSISVTGCLDPNPSGVTGSGSRSGSVSPPTSTGTGATSSSEGSSSSDGSGLSKGALIATIAVAIIALLSFLFGIWQYQRKRKEKSKPNKETRPNNNTNTTTVSQNLYFSRQ